MERLKITCQMPSGQKYFFDCEIQNIRKELYKRTTQIPYDNIILIDDSDQLYTASSALYQVNRKQIKDAVFFKVVDALQLYREYKELLSIKQDNYQKLLETQQQLKKLDQYIKEKEIQHKTDIDKISERNKSQIVDILRTQQAEIEKIKAEKEQKIQEVQDKHNKLELDLNQMIIKSNTQNQNNVQLQAENQTLKQNIEESQNKLIQEKNPLNSQWQTYCQQLNTQLQQQLQQKQQIDFQAQSLYSNIGSLQIQIQELGNELSTQQNEVGKYKSQLKTEKEKLEKANESLSQFETKVAQQVDEMSKSEKKKKKLEDKIQDLEINHKITTNNFNIASSTLSSQELEIKKLKENNKSLNQNINQLGYDNQELLHNKNILEAKIIDLNQQIIQLNQNIDQLNEKIQQQQELLKKKEQEFNKLTKELKVLEQQKQQIDIEGQNLRNQLSQLNLKLEEQQYRVQQSQQEIIKLKNYITTLEQKEKDITNQNSENLVKITQQNNQILQKNGEIFELELKLSQIKNQFQQIEEKNKIDQFSTEQYQKKLDEKNLALKSEIEQINFKLTIKEHILKKLQIQIRDDVYFDKIIGLMDKIMKSPHKIYQFDQNENGIFDLKEYEIFEIIMEYNQAKELLNKNHYFLFEQCLKKNPKGYVTLNRSVQPNAESTFFKGFLSQVKDSTQNEFQGKFFLRKDLIQQTQPFTTIQEAIQFSKNNFLCQLLIEQFNQVLKSQRLKTGDFQIARQFVLKLKDKEEFYYCEMVEEGEFQKINGGTFLPQVSQADSYFNAFSKYVYAFSKENYIITHLQICGKKVYDMIVSTNYKGLFSSLDQGDLEIRQFLDIINIQPADIIQSYWNLNVEKKAKGGFE